jgi:hypothetical protein
MEIHGEQLTAWLQGANAKAHVLKQNLNAKKSGEYDGDYHKSQNDEQDLHFWAVNWMLS